MCLLDHQVQSVSTKVHQHERNVIGWRALPPRSDAIENTLFHLLGCQGRCLPDVFLEAGDAEHFSATVKYFSNPVGIKEDAVVRLELHFQRSRDIHSVRQRTQNHTPGLKRQRTLPTTREHCRGMASSGKDHAAPLRINPGGGQANHLGVTIEAYIIKQKLAQNNGGYQALNMGDSSYGKFDKRIYTDLASDHPIDLCRYQVANCFMGRTGLINGGGASGANDFEEAVVTAVINKRAGGTGLISGRKEFQRPLQEGIQLLNTIQDVYLSPELTVA